MQINVAFVKWKIIKKGTMIVTKLHYYLYIIIIIYYYLYNTLYGISINATLLNNIFTHASN